MPVWQWPRRETCRDDRRHVAGDGDMENMEMLEQVLSLWVWCLLLPSVGQFWHRLNHIRRGPLLGPSIRWKHLPALFHLRISLYTNASSPWNNGKEVPRLGVAEIQKMSPSTTGRCYCCHYLASYWSHQISADQSPSRNYIRCPGVVGKTILDVQVGRKNRKLSGNLLPIIPWWYATTK